MNNLIKKNMKLEMMKPKKTTDKDQGQYLNPTLNLMIKINI